MPSERVDRLRALIPERVIVVLMKEPDLAGHVLDFQSYIIDGEDTMPLFSSAEALRASLAGGDLGRPLLEMDRDLLVRTLKGNWPMLLDPRLPSQFRFTAEELRAAFPRIIHSRTIFRTSSTTPRRPWTITS